MRELPKELTAELLGEVLHYRFKIKILDIKGNNLIYQELNNLGYVLNQAEINIDTLARLMKEWCLKIYNNSHRGCIMSYIETNCYGISEVQDNIFAGSTEFEAVLKATHWVAQEKGLI